MRSGFYTAGVSNLEPQVSSSVEFDDGPGLMALNALDDLRVKTAGKLHFMF